MKSRFTKIRLMVFCALLLTVWSAYSKAASAQADNPEALIHARDSALAAGDLEAAMAFYAEGATVRDANPEPGTTGVIQGKDQIREFLTGRIGVHIRFESINFHVSGDTVTFEQRVWFDDPDLTRLNMLPVETNNTAIVRDGKIHDWLIDIKQEWLSRAEAAFASDQGSQAGMPRTGAADAGFAGSAWLLVLIGLIIVGCGLVLLRTVSPWQKL